MGSLNDYGRRELYGREGRRLRPGRRLLLQCGLAAAFFCGVAALVGSEGPLGEAARYVAGPGLAADSSWVELGQSGLYAVEAAPAGSGGEEAALPQSAAVSGNDTDNTGSAESDGSAGGRSAEETPRFTAPASGVVVSDQTAAAGIPAEAGLLIQGSAGQRVRAAAAGTVSSLSDENGLFRLELTRSGGFTSVYRGLTQLEVAVGDQVALGDPLGACAGGELNFSLLQSGQPVDPLDYLFN